MSRRLSIRTRRYILRYIMAVLISTYLITIIVRLSCTDYYRNLQRRFTRNVLRIPDDISCYTSKEKTRPFWGSRVKDVKKNSIYMISAYCDSSLSVQHACAIESVLNSHGSYNKQIYVFSNMPFKDCACSEGIVKGLLGDPSVHFIPIQIDDFVEDTPLKGIFKRKFLATGMNRHARVAEMLKFATLYKYGGVVIDLDLVMAKPVFFLGWNWGVKVNGSQLGSAVVALTRTTPIGDRLLKRTLKLLKQQSYEEEIDGGLALTEAFRQLCYHRPVQGCSDFRLYDTDFFYPFNRSSSYMLFQPGNPQSKPYGYYVWDPTQVRHRKDSVYVKLMREYCPNVASYSST